MAAIKQIENTYKRIPEGYDVWEILVEYSHDITRICIVDDDFLFIFPKSCRKIIELINTNVKHHIDNIRSDGVYISKDITSYLDNIASNPIQQLRYILDKNICDIYRSIVNHTMSIINWIIRGYKGNDNIQTINNLNTFLYDMFLSQGFTNELMKCSKHITEHINIYGFTYVKDQLNSVIDISEYTKFENVIDDLKTNLLPILFEEGVIRRLPSKRTIAV